MFMKKYFIIILVMTCAAPTGQYVQLQGQPQGPQGQFTCGQQIPFSCAVGQPVTTTTFGQLVTTNTVRQSL